MRGFDRLQGVDDTVCTAIIIKANHEIIEIITFEADRRVGVNRRYDQIAKTVLQGSYAARNIMFAIDIAANTYIDSSHYVSVFASPFDDHPHIAHAAQGPLFIDCDPHPRNAKVGNKDICHALCQRFNEEEIALFGKSD